MSGEKGGFGDSDWDLKDAVCGAGKEMEVVDIPSMGTTAVEIEVRERIGLSGVDGFAIDSKPGTNGAHAVDAFLRDGPVAFGTDVEKEVSSFGGDVDKDADELLSRFPVVIVGGIPPACVHRHADLEVDAGDAG